MMDSRLIRSKSQLETTLAEMDNYEKKRDYLAAQKAKQQSEKLRLEIVKLEKNEKKQAQKRDLADIQDFHQEQIEQLEKYWAQSFAELSKEKDDLLRKQLKSHEEQKRLVELEIQSQLTEFHGSGVVLNLSKKQKSLARLQKFQEAKTIQEQKNQILSMERKNWENLLQHKLKCKLKKLQIKQEQEKKALMKRIESKFEETLKRKQKQLEETRKKHKNILRNCKAMHQKENLGSAGQLKISTVRSLVTSRQRINSPMNSQVRESKLKLQSV